MKKTLKLSFLIFVLPLLNACGNSFDSTSGASHFGSYRTTSKELAEYLDAIGAEPLPVDATLENEGQVRFFSQFDIRFGGIAAILQVAESVVKNKVWPGCDSGLSKNSYNCGELPLGKVVNQQNKLLINIPFDNISGSTDGVSYTVQGTQIPIYLSRTQRSDSSSIIHLDTSSETTVSIPSSFLDSTYFRFSPKEGSLEIEMCFFSPGLQIHSKKTQIKVSAKKKVLFVTLKGDADIDIDPGSMKFDSAKVCTKFNSWVDSQGKTQLKVQSIQVPEFKNLVYQGLKVSVQVQPKGILKIISNILKVVGIRLENKIEQKVVETIQEKAKTFSDNIIKGKIQSGEWFQNYMNQAGFNEKLTQPITNNIQDYFLLYGPGSTHQIKAWFQAACNRVAVNNGGLLKDRFEELCAQNIEVRAYLFLKDPDSVSKSCYQAFFQSNDTAHLSSKWWSADCKIQNKIEVIAPESIAPLYSCFAQVMSKDPNALNDSDVCHQELSLMAQELGKNSSVNDLLLDQEENLEADPNYSKLLEKINFDQINQFLKN
ncbi:MAG: hypothetical protein KDD34_04395 [Bdellovibrionales bacterium]|nr:hypothetical protein [Bdellovibrionales bacterium]